MRINDPRVTKEKIYDKIKEKWESGMTLSEIFDVDIYGLIEGFGYEDNKFFIKMKSELNQKELIELYNKL